MRRAVFAALLLATTLVTGGFPKPFATPVSAAGPVGSVSCGDSPVGAPSTAAAVTGFNALRPERLIDTRDGTGGASGPLSAGCTLRIDTAQVASIPTSANALSLSVTSTDGTTLGYLTVYPCGGLRPGTSNVNLRIGVAAPNSVVAALDSSRAVCIFASASTHLVVDLFGWFGAAGLRYTDIAPVRAFDTRFGPRPDAGSGRIPANTPFTLPLAGTWVPDGAEAALINLTVADSLSDGYLVAYPCGTEPPLASNVNFKRGEPRAGSAMVGLGGGSLCLLSNADTNIIVDVSGYFASAKFGPTNTMQPLGGARIVDSRDGTGGWSTPMAANEVRAFDPTPGTGGDNVYAAVLNVIATEGVHAGHLRVFPCGTATPLISTVNFADTGEATNLITVATGHDGMICVFANVQTEVVIDEFGVLQAPGLAKTLAIAGATPFPSFDPVAQDYAMICPTGGADIGIDAQGTPLVDVTIDGEVVTGLATRHIAVDSYVTVRFRRGAELAEYTLRCLPPDFPPYTVDRPGAPQPGWYMGTLGWSVNPAIGKFVVILDNHGAPVWYKRTAQPVIDVKPWTNGNVAWTPLLGAAFGTTPARGYRVTALNGTLVDELKTSAGTSTDHHDLLSIPGGNRAMITYVVRSGPVDLTAFGAGFFNDDTALDSVIEELAPNGTAVWTWNSSAHFATAETTFPVRFNPPATSHGGAVDMLHINSIDRQPNGDYIVSARHLDAVFRIDRATDKVLWKLGGAGTASNPDNAHSMMIIGDPLNGPKRMHDARLSSTGLLTMFDNRSGTGQPPRVVAYQLDEAAFTATMVWQHTYPVAGLFSFGLGSARRNSDGSYVISWTGGNLQPVLEEVDAQGNRLLAVTDQNLSQSYRFIKVAPATFSRQTLLQTAGGSAQAPP